MYLPFPDFGSRWPQESQDILQKTIDNASVVKYICEEYTKAAYVVRDASMVANCDEMWSLLNPEANEGGTFITVQMARKVNKHVTNFWE